jgi:hypothetical protein
MNKFLWTFEALDKNIAAPLDKGLKSLPSVGPAPMLKPTIGNNVENPFTTFYSGGYEPGSYTVDVIRDFPWTQSPQNPDSIGEIPILHLRENTLEYNPLVNQLIHSFASAATDVSGIVQKIGALLKQNEENNNLTRGDGNGLERAKNAVKNAGKTIAEGLEATNDKKYSLQQELGNTLQSAGVGKEFDVMNPYNNLYTTRHTGWKYKLPWFCDSFRSISNAFADDITSQVGQRGTNLLQSFAAGVFDAADTIANTINTMEPGAYLDMPKPYNFNKTGRAYTIAFPLLNTTTYEQLIRNWQLVFLLSYHNMPNRISRSLIMPPVIYEALVPGTWYAPYAYISSLNIRYAGSVRKMKIIVPSVSKDILNEPSTSFTDIEVVIPEAFLVSISLTELVPEAQNHMYSAITRQNLNSKVKVGEIAQGGQLMDTGRKILSEFNQQSRADAAKESNTIDEPNIDDVDLGF